MTYSWIGIGFLAALTILWHSSRAEMFKRTAADWIVDGLSLVIHFLILPILGGLIVTTLGLYIEPAWKGSVELHPGLALVLNFVLIDYIWYWNHRMMHSKTKLWNLHAVHHSARILDAFATARNSAWSPLFFIYLWFSSLGIFLLKDPEWFLYGGSLGLFINVWGHSRFTPAPGSRLHKILSSVLITPVEHHWHHSNENNYCNFATSFSFWDRIHGTYYSPGRWPKTLGYSPNLNIVRQIVYPVGPDV